MTDKQKEFDATMEALSGMIDDQVPDPIRPVLHRALDLHHEMRGKTWAEWVKRKPTGRER